MSDIVQVTATIVNAWDRQAGESEEDFQTFLAYLLQTPPRRLDQTSVRKTRNELLRMFRDWNWQERTTVYDRHVERIRQEERDAILRQSERERTASQLQILMGLEEVAQREVTKLLRDSKRSEAFGLVKVGDLNKMVANVITLRRLIHGESTENVAVSNKGLEKLSIEELRQLQSLEAKMLTEGEEGATE